MIPRLISLVAGLMLSISSAFCAAAETLLIENTTLIDPSEGALPNQTILVRDERIAAIGPVDQMSIPSDVVRVDGKGKYVIPGLWDAHVHLTFMPELEGAMFPLFVANGITSVRDTGGLVEKVLAKRHEADQGGLPAPRVYVAGPLIDGNPAVYDGKDPGQPLISTSVATPDEARARVDALVEQGVDFLKVYELLSPEVFDAALDQAATHQLPVAGHIPLSVTSSAATGLRSIEHIRNVDLACSSESVSLLEQARNTIQSGEFERGHPLRSYLHKVLRARAYEAQDDAKCDAVMAAFAKSGTRQVPTLNMSSAALSAFFARESWHQTFNYVPKNVRQRWSAFSDQAKGALKTSARTAYGEWMMSSVARMKTQGVEIMAGTDTPILLQTPGFSLHLELQRLVEAGLTPLEALYGATMAPPGFFSMNDRGRLKEGQLSDLVVLNSNPLDDIANTSDIAGVFLRGTYYERKKLDRMLDELEQAFQ